MASVASPEQPITIEESHHGSRLAQGDQRCLNVEELNLVAVCLTRDAAVESPLDLHPVADKGEEKSHVINIAVAFSCGLCRFKFVLDRGECLSELLKTRVFQLHQVVRVVEPLKDLLAEHICLFVHILEVFVALRGLGGAQRAEWTRLPIASCC